MRLHLQHGYLDSHNSGDMSHFPLSEYEQEVIGAWHQILADRDVFEFTTSGSTGVPQTVRLKRQQLDASVLNTANYFGLLPGQTFLCCLNVAYIAGFMMLYRATKLNADCYVVAPASDPFGWVPPEVHFDFVSMVPMQFQSALGYNLPRLKSTCRQMLLGGAAVNPSLNTQIKDHGLEVWIGYGMTETASHIALMKLGGQALMLDGTPAYQLFDNIQVEQDERGCFMIKAEVTDNKWVTTNDLVTIDGRLLVYLGRADRVFNTGGLKVSADWVEYQIAPTMKRHFDGRCYWVTAIPDLRLGQQLVVVLEGLGASELIQLAEFRSNLLAELEQIDRYKMPKAILNLPAFLRTPTGKIDFVANQAQVLNLLGFALTPET